MAPFNARLIISITFILMPTFLQAQSQPRYYYDGNGNNIGSSLPAGQNTYYYDAQGNNVGSAMKAGRNTFYYDAQGNNVGSSMPSGLEHGE